MSIIYISSSTFCAFFLIWKTGKGSVGRRRAIPHELEARQHSAFLRFESSRVSEFESFLNSPTSTYDVRYCCRAGVGFDLCWKSFFRSSLDLLRRRVLLNFELRFGQLSKCHAASVLTPTLIPTCRVDLSAFFVNNSFQHMFRMV